MVVTIFAKIALKDQWLKGYVPFYLSKYKKSAFMV